jgi:hypothetical protein
MSRGVGSFLPRCFPSEARPNSELRDERDDKIFEDCQSSRDSIAA